MLRGDTVQPHSNPLDISNTWKGKFYSFVILFLPNLMVIFFLIYSLLNNCREGKHPEEKKTCMEIRHISQQKALYCLLVYWLP